MEVRNINKGVIDKSHPVKIQNWYFTIEGVYTFNKSPSLVGLSSKYFVFSLLELF